jgi:hypothetical protein
MGFIDPTTVVCDDKLGWEVDATYLGGAHCDKPVT